MEKENKTDKMVLDLFNTVKAKQKEIAVLQKPQWVTSCTIGYNPEVVTDRMNIQTVSDINKLINLYGFLLFQVEYHNRACEALNVIIKFKWMGYTFQEWEKDIKTRINQIGVAAKKSELAVLEKRLDALITLDQRRVMELEAISKELESH
jgi:capsule polysaccharide modification protein KpsS